MASSAVRSAIPNVISWDQRLLARMRRVTSGGTYIPEIDGLRFVAILPVVIYHVFSYVVVARGYSIGYWSDRAFSLGTGGVQLFFVISGFVLAAPFARWRIQGARCPSLRGYYLRRLTRLEPPYMVAILGLFCIRVWARNESVASLAPHLAASAAYLHSLVYGVPSRINTVTWSLEIEVQFYLLLPLFASVFRIRSVALRQLVLSVGVLAGVFTPLWLPYLPPAISNTVFVWLPYFCVGFLFADWCARNTGQVERTAKWDICAAIALPALLALAALSPARWYDVNLIGVAGASAMLFFVALRGKYFHYVLTNAWVCVIGGMCYSLYLLHAQVITLVGSRVIGHVGGYTLPTQVLIMVSVSIPAVLLVCGVYYVLLERPCMRPDWPSRLVRGFSLLHFSG